MKKQFYAVFVIFLFLFATAGAQEVNIKVYNFPIDSGFSASWATPKVGMDGQNGYISWASDTATMDAWIGWEQGSNVKIGHAVNPGEVGTSYLKFPATSTTGYDNIVFAPYTAWWGGNDSLKECSYKFYASAVADPGTKESFDMGEWTMIGDSMANFAANTGFRFNLPAEFADQETVHFLAVFDVYQSEVSAVNYHQFWSFTVKGLPVEDLLTVKQFVFHTDSGFAASWDLPLGLDGMVPGYVTWSTDTSILRNWDGWANASGVIQVGNMVRPTSHGQSYFVMQPFSTEGFINLRLGMFTSKIWPAPPSPFVNTGHRFYVTNVSNPGVKENFDIGEWTKLPDDMFNFKGSTSYTIPFPAGFEQTDTVYLMSIFSADSSEIFAQTWLQFWNFTVSGVSAVPIPKYNITFGVVEGINPLEGATINIAGEQLLTDDQGLAIIELADGKYGFSVNKEGYEDYSDSVTVEGADQQIGVVMVALDPCVQFYEYRTDLAKCDPPFSDQTWDDNDNGLDGECGYITWVSDTTGDDLRPWQSWAVALPQIKIGNYFNSGTADYPGSVGQSYMVFPPVSTVNCNNLKFEHTILWDDLPNDMEHYEHRFYASAAESPGVKENLNMEEWVQIGEPIRNLDPGDEFSWFLPESFNNQPHVRFMGVLDIQQVELKGRWHWIQWNQFTLNGTTYDPSSVDQISNGEYRLYPNPAINQLRLEGLQGHAVVEIYNLLGVSLLQQYVDTRDVWLNIEKLTSGMYIIKICGDMDDATVRFMKQ
jgi:hypothetical protein